MQGCLDKLSCSNGKSKPRGSECSCWSLQCAIALRWESERKKQSKPHSGEAGQWRARKGHGPAVRRRAARWHPEDNCGDTGPYTYILAAQIRNVPKNIYSKPSTLRSKSWDGKIGFTASRYSVFFFFKGWSCGNNLENRWREISKGFKAGTQPLGTC